jgi:hypothetical protein
MAERFTLGLQVAQNREYLTRAGYGLVEAGGPLPVVPVLQNERWLYGIDVPLTLRRRAQATYPVLTLEGADLGLIVDQPAITQSLEVRQ